MDTLHVSPEPAYSDFAQEKLLELLRELLSDYVDLKNRQIDASTDLVEIGVDSLTAAEVLFALEDRLGVRMEDAKEMPRTVGDVIAYALPYMSDGAANGLH